MVSLKRLDNGQLELDSGFGSYKLKVNGKVVESYTTNLAKGGAVTVQGTNVNQYPAPMQSFSFVPIVPRERIASSGWTVDADSFEPGEGEPGNAIDGDPSTFWHTRYSPTETPYPHWLRINLGTPTSFHAIQLLPRMGQSNGRFSKFRIETSTDGQTWQTVARGSGKDSTDPILVEFPEVKSQWVRLVTESEVSGNPWTALAEFRLFKRP
jgi:hypothetical protein